MDLWDWITFCSRLHFLFISQYKKSLKCSFNRQCNCLVFFVLLSLRNVHNEYFWLMEIIWSCCSANVHLVHKKIEIQHRPIIKTNDHGDVNVKCPMFSLWLFGFYWMPLKVYFDWSENGCRERKAQRKSHRKCPKKHFDPGAVPNCIHTRKFNKIYGFDWAHRYAATIACQLRTKLAAAVCEWVCVYSDSRGQSQWYAGTLTCQRLLLLLPGAHMIYKHN